MTPDYSSLAEWLGTFISSPKEIEHGFYDKHSRLTSAGLICFALYLLKNGVFEDEHEMAVAYARETGNFMPEKSISSILRYEREGAEHVR